MYLRINDQPSYAYTGGKAFDARQPTLVFIHGVLHDHSVWVVQARYFAHQGYNVLAVDLPGHGRSQGVCPASVEEAADFILALLKKAGLKQAALIGHSWGSLIALHAASLAPAQGLHITHLALLGTAFPMRVSRTLLDASLNEPIKAIEKVNTFSHNAVAAPIPACTSRSCLHGSTRTLMLRMYRTAMASPSPANIIHLGFQACNSYQAAFLAVNRLLDQANTRQAAIIFIVGNADKMTPPHAAQALIDLLPAATVVKLEASHAMTTQAPLAVLQALDSWLKTSGQKPAQSAQN